MVEDARVRIGFVGVGEMGQCAHLRSYGLVHGCEVVALAEIRPELGKRVAAKYGVPNVYTDHNKMLEEHELDGIVASQPFRRHGVLVPDLLKKGVPLFTEKPLAGSVQAGQAILDALAESGTWHMVGYHKRSDPATIYAKAQIDKWKETGELGDMRYVRIQMPVGVDWIAGGFDDMVKTDEPMPSLALEPAPPDMDDDVYEEYLSFINYYIHQINMMRHLLGEPYEIVFVDRSGVLIVVESSSGVTGTIEVEPYDTTVDWHEECLVAFERGYVRITLPAPLALHRPGRVEIFRDPGHGATPQTIVPTMPWVHAMRQQAVVFVNAIRGECEPCCEAQEAIEDLKAAREYIRMRYGR